MALLQLCESLTTDNHNFWRARNSSKSLTDSQEQLSGHRLPTLPLVHCTANSVQQSWNQSSYKMRLYAQLYLINLWFLVLFSRMSLFQKTFKPMCSSFAFCLECLPAWKLIRPCCTGYMILSMNRSMNIVLYYLNIFHRYPSMVPICREGVRQVFLPCVELAGMQQTCITSQLKLQHPSMGKRFNNLKCAKQSEVAVSSSCHLTKGVVSWLPEERLLDGWMARRRGEGAEVLEDEVFVVKQWFALFNGNSCLPLNLQIQIEKGSSESVRYCNSLRSYFTLPTK